MSIIAKNAVGVHVVRVKTPEGGDYFDLPPSGLRRAVRVANALAGWLSVDEWEEGSAFAPRAFRQLRRDLLEIWPDLDLAACTVQVVCPAEGPDAENGYEAVATYRPGSVVPEIVRELRRCAVADDDADDTVTEPQVLQYRVPLEDPR